jgi:hypothetical protein
MQYLGGAPLESPLVDDACIILFLFFSLTSVMAFISLSWSMAALANLDRWRHLPIHCTTGWGKTQALLQVDGKPFMVEIGFLLICINMI